MNEIISTVLSWVFTQLLIFIPYVVFGTIMYINFKLMRQQSPSVSDDARPLFAYLGGFLIFVIGFAIIQTNTSLQQVSIERGNSFAILISVGIGIALGLFFMYLAHILAKDNSLNWFIFLTNAAASLALMVYIFIQGLQELFTFLMLGFLLGVILYLVYKGNFRKSGKGNYPSSRDGNYPLP